LTGSLFRQILGRIERLAWVIKGSGVSEEGADRWPPIGARGLRGGSVGKTARMMRAERAEWPGNTREMRRRFISEIPVYLACGNESRLT
jgi:hypothetical protein